MWNVIFTGWRAEFLEIGPEPLNRVEIWAVSRPFMDWDELLGVLIEVALDCVGLVGTCSILHEDVVPTAKLGVEISDETVKDCVLVSSLIDGPGNEIRTQHTVGTDGTVAVQHRLSSAALLSRRNGISFSNPKSLIMPVGGIISRYWCGV